MYNSIHRPESAPFSFATLPVELGKKVFSVPFVLRIFRIMFFIHGYCTTVVAALHNFLNIFVPEGLTVYRLSCFLEILHYRGTTIRPAGF